MKNVLIRFGFVCLVFAGMLGYTGWQEMLIAFSKPVDINVDYPEDYDDIKAVETEIDILLDTFAEEETTTKNDSGAITSRDYDYYYVMPVFTEEDTYYVAVKIDSEDSGAYDDIVDATWDYLYGITYELESESVHFQGGFFKMEDELYKYFEQWFEEEEFFESDEEMEKYLLPLVLEPFKYSNVRIMAYVMIGLVVLGIVLLLLAFRVGKKQKKNAPTSSVININGVNYPTSNFENVNKLVVKKKTKKAIKELQMITGLDEASATDVINKWSMYWC